MLEHFKTLYDLIKRLRQECPWDKEQTLESLVPHTLEEVYELSDAVYNCNTDNIKEELGDLFMHLIFYSIIAEEKKDFTLSDTLNYIYQKLVFRHPHIFENHIKFSTAQEVLHNWQKRKKQEGKKYILSGISKNLPSIIKAKRIQEKASAVHFDWNKKEEILEKIEEEILELKTAVKEQSNIEEEFGDVLFSLINYSRFLKIDPEKALQMANKKFINRFNAMEDLAKKKNTNFVEMNLTEKEKLWQEVKKNKTF